MPVAYDPYEEEDYYTLNNPAFSGDRFAPYSEGAIAFDTPTAGGVRFPIAAPASGGQVGTFGAFTPDWQRVIDEMAARDRPAADRQYGMEMDRAIRNQVEDMNPATTQEAIRLRGLFKYQQLIRSGVNSAEAIRQAAPELYYNHPQALASAMNHTLTPQVPSISTVPIGSRQAVFVNGQYRSMVPGEKDPLKELDAKEAGEAVTRALRKLAIAQRPSMGGLMPPDPAAVKAAEQELKDAQSNRRSVIRGVKTPEIAPSTTNIPKWKIDKLKANPNLADDFDAIYGEGAAKSILGK